MPQTIPAIIEAQVLNQTEDALREFVSTAINVGISKPQMILMLRQVAADLQGRVIIHEEPATPQ
jgi:hypothetical protein